MEKTCYWLNVRAEKLNIVILSMLYEYKELETDKYILVTNF